MTMSIARPDIKELPNPTDPPNVLNETTSLLRQIVKELQELHSLGQTPTPGTFILSPDAASGVNGRILLSHVRTRIERIVITASVAATNFTIQIGSSAWLTIAPTTANLTIIDLPVALVLERGSALQILSDKEGWTGYCVGYVE